MQNHTIAHTIEPENRRDERGVSQRLNWYAVHVKSRHEFVAWQELRRKGIGTFLPTVNKVSQWTDRKKVIEQPLFAGYVFVETAPDPRSLLEVLKSRGVVAFISLEPGVPTPVLPDEIESLRLLVNSGRDLDVFPGLKEGARVRLKRGPLENAEGILARNDREYVFHVNVDLLGRSVSIKVTPQDLDLV